MSKTLELETARNVARLARIALSESELGEAAAQLETILQYVGQLAAVEIADDVQPFYGATGVRDAISDTREDTPIPSQARDELFSNAPHTDDEFYLVPPVFKS